MGWVRAPKIWGVALAAIASSTGCQDAGPTATERNRFPSDVQVILERCPPKDGLVYYDCVRLGPPKDLPFVRAPGGDTERLAFLADARPAVRALVGQVLDDRPCPSPEMCAYAAHRALAEQLLAAAESESDARVTRELAGPIARIDVAKTGLEPRVERFLAGAPRETAERALDIWLSFNPSVLPAMARLADAPNRELARASLRGMRHGLHGPLRRDVCSLLVEKFGESTDYDYLGETILFGDRGQDCSLVWDDFLTHAEQRVNQGLRLTSGSRHWFERLRSRMQETRYRDPAISDAHLARTLALMVQVSQARRLDTETRRLALVYAARHHPDEQAFLGRFSSDADPELRKVAADWKAREAS